MRTITAILNEFEEDALPQAPVAPWMRDVDYAIQDIEASRAVALATAKMHDELKTKAESLRAGSGQRVEVQKFVKGLRGVEAKVAAAADALKELLALLDEPPPEPEIPEETEAEFGASMAPLRAGRMK